MNEKFEVDREFLFLGRTFEEYQDLFELEPADLRRGPILDCPGGPSSFTAVASALGASVTAVDPMYERSLDELEAECSESVDRNMEQVREKRDLFDFDYYGSVENRGRFLRAATERFLSDYERSPDRSVAAGLPDPPFADDEFALSLSGNLLFLYDDRLDETFHVAAARELARVTGDELRVFPLASLDLERSGLVEPVVDALRGDGRDVRFEPVDYDLRPAAEEMLVVSPRSAEWPAGAGRELFADQRAAVRPAMGYGAAPFDHDGVPVTTTSLDAAARASTPRSPAGPK
ncbi:class I SAM-dependent methyltransferase [Halomicrobium urmianum]|uniref:class I SAM-dependent methyltransferase n=1 Tax=Halomicrobium urmianum TaxID=1586233 RepID=UPI001CDA3C39|nr:class I SAM-dependent methyltransferase [Halomicrobium urmianum]